MLLQSGVDARVVALDAVFARVFDVVHGAVGVAQKPRGVERVLGVDAHPDARAHAHDLPFDEKGLVEGELERFGDAHRFVAAAHVVQHEDVLVAAHAGQEVALAAIGAQALRDEHQERVARLVAHGVVDEFKAVDVDKEECQLVG